MKARVVLRNLVRVFYRDGDSAERALEKQRAQAALRRHQDRRREQGGPGMHG